MKEIILEAVAQTLEDHGITLSDFLLNLLASQKYNNHFMASDLLSRSTEILASLVNHPLNNGKLDGQVQQLAVEAYLAEMKYIAAEDAGWHFGVYQSTVKQFEEFSLEDMGQELEKNAPKLWHLVGLLLGGCTEETAVLGMDSDGDAIMDDDTYWDEVDEIDLEGFVNGLTGDKVPMAAADKRNMRHTAILLIVSA